MPQTEQHTATPWAINPFAADYQVISTDGDHSERRMTALKARGLDKFKAISIGTALGQIAIIPLDESNEANAVFIVKAVNFHAELVEALENAFLAMGRIGANHALDHQCRGAWENARAVLAKAKSAA